MALESGSHTHAAVPSGSPQEGKAEEIECTTTRDPPPSLAASADDEMCRQELSPLSSPERLGELGACTDKATPLATTTVLHEGMKQPKEAAEGTEGLSHNQASVVSLKGGRVGLSGGSVEATAASEQQTKARDQAKRLALEVARLRSSLRATTSELNTERSARVRIEDEWWKKMGAWEEERDNLVASKQEAERLSRSAENESARGLAESKAREAKAASECAARETAQHKADSVMKHVLKVQDRLVQALQTELSMTNRAREVAQDDARETKDQLRLYVQDFLLWRDRAKRLESRKVDPEAATPQQHSEGGGTEPATTEASLAAKKGFAEHAGSTQTGRNDEELADDSIPEKYARYFETDTGGYPITPTNAALFGMQEAEGPQKEGPEAMETSTAAAAWSTRLAMTGSSSSSASSRAHFQRSMKAQQAASARLEKYLMKARADLQSIYAGNRTADVGGGGGGSGGGGKAVSAVLRPGTKERLGIALSEGAFDEVDGDGGEGGNGSQCPPESPTSEEKRSGGAYMQEKTGESVATRVAEGSHLARVLAVLLGGDPTAAEAVAGRVSDAPSLPLRLTDFPATLQAVFGEGPAATSAAAATAAFEHRVVSSKGAHERSEETRLRRQKRRWARECPVEIDRKSDFGLARKAAANGHSGHPAANTTGRVHHVDGCGRKEPRPETGLPSAGASPAVSGVAEGRESCSLTRAFHGYKAKSSLLERWLAERVSPSLSQPDAEIL